MSAPETTPATGTKRPPRNRQRGVALLITLTWIALMVALVAEFTYGTSVDAACMPVTR